MAESARLSEVERRVNEHLEDIDRALAAKGVPLIERRSITGDVEAQIRDMLAENAGGNPTPADVEAVVRKLDAPESYVEETDAAPVKRAPLVASEPQFRAFRRRVLTGGLIIGVASLPIGIALKLPFVWGLSLVGIAVASIKLAGDTR